MWVSFAIYEPHDGCDIHDAVTHIARMPAVLEKRSSIDVAIIKSLEHPLVAVFTVWKGGSIGDGLEPNLREADAFTKGMDSAVKIVDSGWFRLSSREIGRGNSQHSYRWVTLIAGRYTSSWKIQDVFSLPRHTQVLLRTTQGYIILLVL